jgi:hypothetical protein
MFCGVVGGDGCGDCDALGGKNGLTGLRLYVRVVWGGKQWMSVYQIGRLKEGSAVVWCLGEDALVLGMEDCVSAMDGI